MYMGVQCVVCCMFRSRFLRAGALCVHTHAMVRAQGRALCACLGPPGLRAGSALTRADVLVLLCVLRFFGRCNGKGYGVITKRFTS